MTRAEIIAELQAHGLDKCYGRTFDRCLKKELVEAWEGLQANVKHLSHSQISMFQRCGLQWHYRYQEGIKIAPSAPMVLGSSADSAINLNYEGKIKSGSDESLSVLEDKFHEEWDARRVEIVDWKGDKADDLESKGRASLKAFRQEIAPATHPIEVQLEKILTFSNRPWTFVGFIDLIAHKYNDEKKVIIDNKLTKRSPSPEIVHVHDQLTAYSAAEGIQDVGLDIMIYGNKEPKTLSLAGTRSEKDAKRYWRVVDAVYDSIVKGVFLPAPRSTGNSGNWVCTPEWCGYWQICHEEF